MSPCLIGVAERMNRTLVERVKCLLSKNELPKLCGVKHLTKLYKSKIFHHVCVLLCLATFMTYIISYPK